MFSWNDVDVIFTFNFDRDLELNLSQSHKDLDSYSAYIIELLQLNLDNGRSV